MKSITNILLIVMALGIVLPKGTLHTVVHIPDLIEHFYEHRSENEQVSLFDFIAEHAGQPNHEHQDKHAHDDLPLNPSHQSSDHNQVWNIAVPKSDIFNLKRLGTISKIVFQEIFYHSEYLQNIWQPPNMG